MNFNLTTSFKPTGDQPSAIESLIEGVKKDEKYHDNGTMLDESQLLDD